MEKLFYLKANRILGHHFIRGNILLLSLIPFISIWSLPTRAQVGLIERRNSSGSQQTFSYQIRSTFGTSTSATATGNMTADAEAVVIVKPGSITTNKIGDGEGNASAVFVATPTGANADLTGITGENRYELDAGTYFRSYVKTRDPNIQYEGTSTGSSSAYVIQSTTLTIEQGTNQFVNTFQQVF